MKHVAFVIIEVSGNEYLIL
uniref:Uncharacterized protein n=1 Tax=Moniliophthora roreri TaxID=221103 RepID=A0A0W0FT37_MONRR